jgi:hypothetical protein
MAICDLSSKNPNVLYELGIRQAFDKPVLLVGDDDPSKIFDIGNINTHMYKKRLNYREVIDDQKKISEMLIGTYNNTDKEYNSLISILKIESALDNYDTKNDIKENDVLKIMYQEIMSLKDDIREINQKMKNSNDSTIAIDKFDVNREDYSANELEYLYNTILVDANKFLKRGKMNMSIERYIQNSNKLVERIDMIIKTSELSENNLSKLISLRNRLDDEKKKAIMDMS